MSDEQIREALNAHWRASAAGDANAEHDIYADDAVLREYPQSGEAGSQGRSNLQALHPVIIPASRRASISDECSEQAISESRNHTITYRGSRPTP